MIKLSKFEGLNFSAKAGLPVIGAE